MNMLKESGASTADPATKAQIATYATQLGLPVGAITSYLESTPTTSKIVAHNTVDTVGGGKAWTILSQDAQGNITTQTVGIPGGTSSDTKTKRTEQE
jgi:hypothetical protein